MHLWPAAIACALIAWAPAWGACTGSPYNQLDFWLGSWHDPATPPTERYTVRSTAGGCAIEEVLSDHGGRVKGVGVAGWDDERKQWRQLWVDADRTVTVYNGAPSADGKFVLTSEPKMDGTQWQYTYLNIGLTSIDAEYATRRREEETWRTVWQGRFHRIEGTHK